ncbi:DUF305 domain-containing protein [Stappia sp. TSB10P1A]|uniref:CopM family metallochaperone n=1 Tax=Stappia sp. TSB10P1A TaxID=2003585 RepID=UPI001643853D|nr:DUF305 domain-containing protein [Stappia sp. TSB10P1A]
MNTLKFAVAAIFAASLSTPALAQDEAAFQLPEQCTAGSAMDHAGHGGMHGGGRETGMMRMEGMDMAGMTDFQRQNMEKMAVTMPAMMDGMMQGDPDVAFACAMIAHHQGAIDMARIQLEHGKDPWIRALSEQIIEAQVREIADMTQWLADNAR